MLLINVLVLFGSFIAHAQPVHQPNCTMVLCIAPTCSDSYIPPGKCCPVCPKDTEKPGICIRQKSRGRCHSLCKDDSDCPQDKKCCSNGCGLECQSPDGTVLPDKCSLIACDVPRDCTDTYIPVGQCCPECRTGRPCYHHGSVYKNGQTFKDHCNSCSCDNGRVSCTQKVCDPVRPGKCPRRTSSSHVGFCSERCSTDSDCPSNQKCCNTGCGHYCQDPETDVHCQGVVCPIVRCAIQRTFPWECCPRCFPFLPLKQQNRY